MGLEAYVIPIALLLLVAFAPAAIFAGSVARAKRYRREPSHAIRKAFLWGATGAAGIALIVNTLAGGTLDRPYLLQDVRAEIAVALVIAPLVEEAAKPLVLMMGAVRRNCDEVVDGLIYGAVAGLGFSATENLFYEIAALANGGAVAFGITAVVRTFSSSLLHATATAITGYGIARYLNGRSGFLGVVPFYILAVLLHAGFNAVATFAVEFALLPLIAVAIIGFQRVRRRVRDLSMVAPHNRWDAIGPGREVAGWQRVEEVPRVRVRPAEPEHWYPVDDPSRRHR